MLSLLVFRCVNQQVFEIAEHLHKLFENGDDKTQGRGCLSGMDAEGEKNLFGSLCLAVAFEHFLSLILDEAIYEKHRIHLRIAAHLLRDIVRR